MEQARDDAEALARRDQLRESVPMALQRDAIYYGIDGERFGPVDLETLRDMVRDGRLMPSDYVWDEDADNWIEIGRFEEITRRDGESEAEHRQEGPAPTLEPLPVDHPSVRRDPAPLPCAGFGARLLAWIIDFFVSLPVTLLWLVEIQDRVGLEYVDVLFRPPPTDPAAALAQMKFQLATQAGLLLIRWVYFASFESSRWQATPGKKLMRLVVTDERGYRLSFGRASGRFFAKILSELTFFFGFVMIGFTDRHQGLHDKVARTLVLHR
jgi:uncharacterized RDD family membrane protein YckC